MRPTDADALMPLFIEKANKMKDRHGVKLGEEWLLNYDDIKDVIDNAPTVEPQKIVTIPLELIEKLALCVVDIVGNIDWEKAIEAYKARPQGEWLNHNSYFKRCSICNKVVGFDYIEQEGERFNYCPNCGADMRGGRK